MHETTGQAFEDEWVIWNSNNGLLTSVTLGDIESGDKGTTAWLDEPFDMVGPFSLDELETHGRIAFAECLVMSRQRWQTDQVELRLQSQKIRQVAEQRVKEKVQRSTSNKYKQLNNHKTFNEQQHRKILKLPLKGNLESSQIKKAFRKLAQKVHPDTGGNHDQFVRITEARNALLEFIS